MPVRPTVVEREVGGRTLRLETGRIAKLASGSVLVSYADSAVLCTAVRANPRPGLDFFPLQCDYRERMAAAGRYPGGFRKREGAPSEKEILTMRMMDRPIRPLFPDGFIDEVQIQAFVMSHDGQNDTDVLACVGAAAALHLTDAPFQGPLATVRVARILTDDGPSFVINPTQAQLEFSDLDLVVAGHDDGINMIEVGAAEIDEASMIAALRFGYDHGIKPILAMMRELREKCGAPERRLGELSKPSDEVIALVKKVAERDLIEARKIKGKADRGAAVDAVRDRVLAENFAIPAGLPYGEHLAAEKRAREAKEAFRTLEKKITHMLVAEHGIRADGRGLREIRPLDMTVGIFPRTHGSAFFQRGETQSMVSCTLGTVKDEQIVDGLLPEYAKKFYLHYYFPPMCTGEAGRIAGPGRREIGHGALAERSLLGILPGTEEFPYTVRIISDITESNGSSSMASVCGGCLALMDAGVPIKATCAGISVGRFTSAAGKVSHVTDIIGEEDFFGEMDFKVSGTRAGITGIQLDLKARGLSVEEIESILGQAREGRLFLIDEMEKVLPAPRTELSRYAPIITVVHIDPEKIGKLIGPGGKTIRGIQERTGAQIDVEEDGTVYIACADREMGERARQEVESLGAEIKLGAIYEGKVVSIKDFGAFIELGPGTDGMCHISELAHGYVKTVGDVIKLGDTVKVKVINIDENGRIKLSRKALLDPPPPGSEEERSAEQGERGDRGDRGGRGGDRGGRRGGGGDRGHRREGRPSGEH
ncbi:MAG TPA: polyribonucleotide nucleotidyltransferase [Phycisphaerales bacterium]|mgnify:CR=1 FL=1|nr:polyribonucleotide nucleotidyltransferase [Phycisphaerales bacterium]HMP35826.1 polyribonucleotide nucleotidyltransferase [Phycisphaerales bacterium]